MNFGIRAICWSRMNSLPPTYLHHDDSTPDLGKGPEGEKKRVNLYRTAFHESSLEHRRTPRRRRNRCGSLGPAAAFIRASSTGIAAHGESRSLSPRTVTICRFANGKIVEGFVNWDALGPHAPTRRRPRAHQIPGRPQTNKPTVPGEKPKRPAPYALVRCRLFSLHSQM